MSELFSLFCADLALRFAFCSSATYAVLPIPMNGSWVTTEEWIKWAYGVWKPHLDFLSCHIARVLANVLRPASVMPRS